MNNILYFPTRHIRDASSTGYTSGRNSCLDTPEAASTAKTRKGGTDDHCEMACGVTPIRRASSTCPPTDSFARSSAESDLLMRTISSMALLQSQATPYCLDKDSLYDADMTLGKRIKAARERLSPRVTQAKVAAEFRVTVQAISGWERDDSIPDVDKIAKLARFLKVPAIWLLEGRGQPPAADGLESVMERLDPEQRSLLEAMAQTLLKRHSNVA